MRELNHNTLSYAGPKGSDVAIRVGSQGTNHMVNYFLNGVGPTTLAKGKKIEFKLKTTAGGKTVLQLNLEYSANGTYTVAVENVSNCALNSSNNECANTFDDFPDGNTLNYSFLAE